MKTRLGLSYKKLIKISPKHKSQEKVRHMMQSALLLMSLEDESYEKVYVDEFSFDPRKTEYFGWGKKNFPSFLSSKCTFHTISFIVGLSADRYFGVMGHTGGINSEIFIVYLSEIFRQFQSQETRKKKRLNVV